MRAKIRWLTAAEGGRQDPPTGRRYVAPARIEGLEANWPAEAWSLVLEFVPGSVSQLEFEASVRFLSEGAPHHLLQPGRSLELYEGARRVAVGTIINVGRARRP